MSRTPLVLGNWKMHGNTASIELLLAGIRAGWPDGQSVQVGVCPPYPYLSLVAARLAGSPVTWGAQNIAAFEQGAFTGEVCADMLADLSCRWTLIGHSERRALFGESDGVVADKVTRAMAGGITPVICVGESLQEREAGQMQAVLARQIDSFCAVLPKASTAFVVAYEPVWAIGTGVTASPEQAQAAHRFIRDRMAAQGIAAAAQVRILYGGSVKPGNAAELFAQPDVDGGLIGGASLVAEDFLLICRAAAGQA